MIVTVFMTLMVCAGSAQGEDVIAAFRKAWDIQPGVMRKLGDEGWKARMVALRELVKLGPKGLPALLTALDDQDPEVRGLATQVIGFLAEPSVVDRMDRLLVEDPDPTVRLYAAGALGMTGTMRSKPLYERVASQDDNKDVRAHVRLALERNGAGLSPEVRKQFEGFRHEMIDTARLGQSAPDFTLTSANGQTYRLSELRGRKTAVVSFIYGTGTYGLVRQYGERRKDFAERGAEVFLIDPHDTRRVTLLLRKAGFDASALPAPVLCDPAHVASAMYGVAFQMKQYTEWSNRPATFVIDRKGVIRWQHRGQNYSDRPKPEEVLQVLGGLQ